MPYQPEGPVTLAELCARRYRLLRRKRRCADCGKRLPDGWRFVRCHADLVTRRLAMRDARKIAAPVAKTA